MKPSLVVAIPYRWGAWRTDLHYAFCRWAREEGWDGVAVLVCAPFESRVHVVCVHRHLPVEALRRWERRACAVVWHHVREKRAQEAEEAEREQGCTSAMCNDWWSNGYAGTGTRSSRSGRGDMRSSAPPASKRSARADGRGTRSGRPTSISHGREAIDG